MSTTANNNNTSSPIPEYVQRMSPTVAVAISEQRIRGEKPKKDAPR